ncbi:diguanylate cyclase/phosphodiesterase with PAS/PAC and Chase sensor(s) [Pseudoalteromonas luteoviolacea B = ATCC 29581]|nr:diguanylate cyclase/phosphodiesterase with PAS/PAC and Chase sensor(s) [Pseudoalteromonas luteoviolacea B = ATCC 29581]
MHVGSLTRVCLVVFIWLINAFNTSVYAQDDKKITLSVLQSNQIGIDAQSALNRKDYKAVDSNSIPLSSRGAEYWFKAELNALDESTYIVLELKLRSQLDAFWVNQNSGLLNPVTVELHNDFYVIDLSKIPYQKLDNTQPIQHRKLLIRINNQYKNEVRIELLSQSVLQQRITTSWIYSGIKLGLVGMIMLVVFSLALVRQSWKVTVGAIYLLLLQLLLVSLTGQNSFSLANSVADFIILSRDSWLVFASGLGVFYFLFNFKLKEFHSRNYVVGVLILVCSVGLGVVSLLTVVPSFVLVTLSFIGILFNCTVVFYYGRKHDGRWTFSTKLTFAGCFLFIVITTVWLLSQVTNIPMLNFIELVENTIVLHVFLLTSAMIVRESERQKSFLFYTLHDQDTGYPNKAYLLHELKKRSDHNRPHTLILFKAKVVDQTKINFGIEFSKKHLKKLLSKLNEQVSALNGKAIEIQSNQNKYIFRLEDNLFALLLDGKLELSLIEQYVCVITALFEEGVKYQGIQLVDALEIGVANYPVHSDKADKTVQRALQAMSNKSLSTAKWHIFDVASTVLSERKLKIASAIREAIDSESFELYFQPQVCLKTGQVYGAEALIRWHHPSLGQLAPDQFIPIAESSGLIHDITEWVIEKGLNYQQQLTQLMPKHVISLNISGRDLAHKELPVHLMTLITQLGLSAQQITLEVTESATIGNINAVRGVFHDYRQIGVMLAIDDFGTGYSSLAYLTQLGFDELKIDKQFVMNIENIPTNQTICSATCDMAHSLGAFVIAEGVESQAAYNKLKLYGCNFGQGYYIARPMPFKDYLQWLKESSQGGADIMQQGV